MRARTCLLFEHSLQIQELTAAAAVAQNLSYLRQMKASILAILLCFAAPASAAEMAGYSWSGQGTPKFLRVNVAGHNVRSSADFFGRADNISGQTSPNTMYAISRVEPLRDGISVGVLDQGQERFIFVPRNRQRHFQFCESEACLSDLTQVLEALAGQNIRTSDLFACGIALKADGTPIMEGEARTVVDMPRPQPRPIALLRQFDSRIPTAQRPQRQVAVASAPGTLSVRPLWESSREGSRQWTAQLLDSIRRHGRGLLATNRLSDANYWCPNYSRLTSAQREEFWVHVLNGIARVESQFRASPPPFDETLHRNVRSGRILPDRYSMGLFQLSYTSAAQRPYRGFCNFDWARDRGRDVSDRSLTIHDPKKQMDCAVGILNKWVSQDRGLGRQSNNGGARFWSSLRDSNPKSTLLRASLRRFTPCGVR